uniref:Uncharacterized protein n=1 Tax=Magallana gigas TaxID=29159 RepID=A0A8W8I440_MAGGI
MPVCNVGTGEAICEVLDGTFRKFDISWTNVVAFTSDNCNVMKGTNNSVLSRIKAVQPDVFDSDRCLMGCLKSEMERLLGNYLARFIKVSFFKENNVDLTQLPFCSDEAQLPDDLIAVGMSARSYLAEEGENIPIATPSRFFL